MTVARDAKAAREWTTTGQPNCRASASCLANASSCHALMREASAASSGRRKWSSPSSPSATGSVVSAKNGERAVTLSSQPSSTWQGWSPTV